MATLYKICVDGELATANITMTALGSTTTTIHTNLAGCEVRTTSQRYEFSASQPSDNAYRVFYQYWVDYKTDFEYTTQGLRQENWTTMSAGQTSAVITVPTYILTRCPNDSDPYAPAQFAEEQ